MGKLLVPAFYYQEVRQLDLIIRRIVMDNRATADEKQQVKDACATLVTILVNMQRKQRTGNA